MGNAMYLDIHLETDHLYPGGKFIENRFTSREQKTNMKRNKSSISGEVKNM